MNVDFEDLVAQLKLVVATENRVLKKELKEELLEELEASRPLLKPPL